MGYDGTKHLHNCIGVSEIQMEKSSDAANQK
jgi:hypothetical protein